MSNLKRQSLLFNRDRFAEIVPVHAYDDEHNIFFIEGDVEYLGAVFYGLPLIGADDSTTQMIRSAYSGDLPDNTIIQISYVSSSYIDGLIQVYGSSRESLLRRADGLSLDQKRLLHQQHERRKDFLRGGAEEPLSRSSPVRLKNSLLVMSIKVPVSGNPSERELQDVKASIQRFQTTMKQVGLDPRVANGDIYVRLLRTMLFMGEEPESWYDDDRLIREQIMPFDKDMENHRDHAKVGDNYIRSLSVQNYPDQISLAQFNKLIGDPFGSHQQIADPFIMTLTTVVPPQANELKTIKSKKASIDYQNQGKWSRYVAKIGRKAEGFRALEECIEDGNRPVKLWSNILVFSKSYEDSGRAAAGVRTHFQMEGFEVHEDRNMHAPFLVANLPLFGEISHVSKTQRYYTMTGAQACQLTPIIGEWNGSGRGGAMAFIGRRGQLMLFDLFDSDTNYNLVIAAESGAGKSFVANDLIASYLQKGAKVRVVDQGRSYQKLSDAIDGQYIEFDDKPISLNPFTNIVNIDEELDLLCVIIAKMASPNDGFDDWQLSQTAQVIKSLWDKRGRETTMTDVAEAFAELGREAQADGSRWTDIAQQLFPYTRHGQYASYFNSPNTLDYDNSLVVFELDNLRSKKDLQQVVLLQLITQLQAECYQGDRSVPKIVLIDEAWEMFEDPMVAKFLEGAYRRFRKYRAACVVVTQSLDDLYNSASGEAIAKNSANQIVLRQNAEAIESLRKTDRFQIGDWGFEMMKSLHTERGEYSELLVRCGERWGVGRFIAERYTQLLYSTDPHEVSAIDAHRKEGMTVDEAIETIIQVETGLVPQRKPSAREQSDRMSEVEAITASNASAG